MQEAATRPYMADRELVQQALQGSQYAFETLVERYRTPLSRFVSRYVADYDMQCDLVQQVLIQLYLSLPTLRTEKPLHAWLFRVARNRCLDELRRKTHKPFSELEVENDEGEICFQFDLFDPSPALDDLVERHEIQQRLRQAIGRLPPKYQPIVWLRYTTLLNFAEIGSLLNMPEATAKTYFQRAKVILRRMLISIRDES